MKQATEHPYYGLLSEGVTKSLIEHEKKVVKTARALSNAQTASERRNILSTTNQQKETGIRKLSKDAIAFGSAMMKGMRK